MTRFFTISAMFLAFLVAVFAVANLLEIRWLLLGIIASVLILGYAHLTGQ